MKNKLLTIILIFLLLLVSVPSAYSYFFTYTKATGTIAINLMDDSDIDECVKESEKEVTITAKDNSDPIFVRVRVFKADDVKVVTSTSNWSHEQDDVWYYYDLPIDGINTDLFGNTAEIKFTVSIPSTGDTEFAEDETRHVVVVYEGTPALFSATVPSSGSYYGDETIGYWYADWTTVLPAVEEGD